MSPTPTNQPDKLTLEFLYDLGLNRDEARIYLTLIQKGALTTLEIARKTGISRTTVYRSLEHLKTEKVVEEVVDEHRTLAAAVPPERLEQLIQTKQAQITQLTTLFPQVQEYLNQQINRRQPDTKVLFYRGQDGIQQMLYNVLRAKKEIVGFTPQEFNAIIGEKFAFKIYQEMCDNQITMRNLISDRYVEKAGGMQNVFKPFHPTFDKLFTTRYIPKNTLDINTQMDIYNDVIAIYSPSGEDIFGLEIYNHKVAKMQKQIFEILWQMATPEANLIKKSTNTK